MSAWRHNSRCRACGYRQPGEYSRFDYLCPACGTGTGYAFLLWRTVIERPVQCGFLGLRRRWEERPDDEPFEVDQAEHRGGFVP